MLDWINANTGVLNLVFSFLVAISTVVYAVLTARLVGETRRMREVQTEPTLAIHIEPSELGLNFINLVLRNVGSAAARDVRLTLSRDFEWARGRFLSGAGLFRHPIPYFAPGKVVTMFLTSVLDDVHGKSDDLSHLSFQIDAEYHNGEGRRFRESFEIDFRHLEMLVGIGEPPLVSVAKHLERIDQQFQRVTSGHARIRVVSYTPEDVRREADDVRARVDAARAPKPQENAT